MAEQLELVHEYSDEDFARDLGLVLGHVEADGSEAMAVGALERIVVSHLGIIRSVANKFDGVVGMTNTLETGDFIQVGVEGIYDTLARTDETMHPKAFHSYSKIRVFDAMFKMSAEMSGAISLSEGSLKKLIRVRRINQALETGANLSDLLEAEKMTITSYARFCGVHLLATPRPIDEEDVEEASVNPLAESSHGELSTDPAELYEQYESRELVREALSLMKERPRLVLHMLHGFDGSEKRTMAEVGEHLGVTESRISQIHSKAVKDLRAILTSKFNFWGDK